MRYAGTGSGVAAAWVGVGAVLVSAAALVALLWLSPEFAPSWRMVSEYANGNFGWVLSLMFYAWAVASAAMVVALWPLSGDWVGRIGLVLLVLAAVGQAMGGLFDINRALDDTAFQIGLPSMVLAAGMLTFAARTAGLGLPLWAGFLPLATVIALGVSMGMLFSSIRFAGVDMSAQAGLMAALPEGVTTWVGWANRSVIWGHHVWLLLAAWAVLTAN